MCLVTVHIIIEKIGSGCLFHFKGFDCDSSFESLNKKCLPLKFLPKKNSFLGLTCLPRNITNGFFFFCV
jgi:hypothetical protein